MKMRENKYRAWDIENETMLYNVNGISNDNSIFMWSTGEYRKYKGYIPLQYTEVKDCNGKDVYEGDILKIYIPNWTNSDKVEMFVIDDFYSDVSYLQEVYKHCEECRLDGEHDYIEVIGNIYEHKNILESVE